MKKNSTVSRASCDTNKKRENGLNKFSTNQDNTLLYVDQGSKADLSRKKFKIL